LKKIELKSLCLFLFFLLIFTNFSFAKEDISKNTEENILENNIDIIESGNDILNETMESFEDSNTNNYFQVEGSDYIAKSLRAKVLEASEEYEYKNEYYTVKAQNVKVIITDKEYNGKEYDVIYFLEDDFNTRLPLYHKLRKNDNVYVYITFENDVQVGEIYVQYYDKTNWIIILSAFFAISIAFIGGKKGIRALVGLFITILLIFKALIPGIINGYNPILLTILISIITILCTFFIVSGINKKSLCAIIGTSCGVIFAGVLGLIFSNLMQLTGINEHSRMIAASISSDKEMISFTGIMLSAIMISALGACMDVGMSISSALFELKEKKPELTSKELIKSGFNIGKDVMGTMTNTLILAYVGSSLLCIMLYVINDFEISAILNQEDIAMEILKSIAGSIGLIYTIPLTAIVSGILLENNKENTNIKFNKDAYVKENVFKG